MIRNLKVLGLALVALFAMTAMATSASAASFTSNAGETTITATQSNTHELKVTESVITCTTADFHGTVKGNSVSSVTLKPIYTGCKTNLGTEVKVTGFGHYGESSTCDYVLYAAGTADLVCQAGADVTIDAGPCTVTIPGQKGLSSVSYTNVAGGTISASMTINNIEGTHTDGFLCPFNGSGSFKNGLLTGNTTVQGTDVETGKPTSISWDA